MTPLTEQENRLIHAYVEPGGCWHEFVVAFPHPGVTDYTYRGHKCKKCGFYWPTKIENGHGCPDYTSQPYFDNLLRVLFGEEEMWRLFWHWTGTDSDAPMVTSLFALWLFHPDHRTRFLRLFLDFLSLEETQREWGFEPCPQVNCQSLECKEKVKKQPPDLTAGEF